MTELAKHRFRREYANESDRKCHQCGRQYGLEEMLAAFQEGGIIIQGFTGRVFCDPPCFDTYKEDEGL